MRKTVLLAVAALWVGTALVAGDVRVMAPPVAKARPDPFAPKPDDDEGTRKIKELLRTKKATFDFVETPLQDALSFVRALLGVNIVIDPKVKLKEPLTLTVKEMNVGAALQWMLRLGGAELEIRNGAIYVAPAKTPQRTVRPQYYQPRAARRMLGKAQIKLGTVATVELYLYEDDLPPETRQMLLKLLQSSLEAELRRAAAPAPEGGL